jgi:hypothetical protein
MTVELGDPISVKINGLPPAAKTISGRSELGDGRIAHREVGVDRVVRECDVIARAAEELKMAGW